MGILICTSCFWQLVKCNKLKEMIKISATKKQIVLYLGRNKDATNTMIANFLGKEKTGISKHLKGLRNDGYVKTLRKSEGRKTRNFNNLTDRGFVVLRSIEEEKDLEQVVKKLLQVEKLSTCLNLETETNQVLREGKEKRQVDETLQQVENKSISLPSNNKYDQENINLRRTSLPSGLDLYRDKTKVQVELFSEDIVFLWKLYRKICNIRIHGDYQDNLENLCKRLEKSKRS